jgi:CheY-like chemotaxis protein
MGCAALPTDWSDNSSRYEIRGLKALALGAVCGKYRCESLFMNQLESSPNRAPEPSRDLIFVVDDEELLAALACQVLESDGYTVKSFRNPKDILKLLREDGARPALLITDYNMDEMNGLELITSSHEIHPTMKTILLSGTVDASFTATHPARVNRFLRKPYQPQQLKTVVGELLRA